MRDLLAIQLLLCSCSGLVSRAHATQPHGDPSAIGLCNRSFANKVPQTMCAVSAVKPADRNEQRQVSRMRPAWEEVERRAAIMGEGEKGTEEAILSIEQLDLDFSVLSALLTKLQIRSKQTDIWVDAQEFPAVKAFGDQMKTDDVDQSEADIIYFLNAAEVELEGKPSGSEGKQCIAAAGLHNRLLAAIIQAAPQQSTAAFNKRVLQAIEGKEASLPATSLLKLLNTVPRANLKFAFRCWISSCFK